MNQLGKLNPIRTPRLFVIHAIVVAIARYFLGNQFVVTWAGEFMIRAEHAAIINYPAKQKSKL